MVVPAAGNGPRRQGFDRLEVGVRVEADDLPLSLDGGFSCFGHARRFLRPSDGCGLRPEPGRNRGIDSVVPGGAPIPASGGELGAFRREVRKGVQILAPAIRSLRQDARIGQTEFQDARPFQVARGEPVALSYLPVLRGCDPGKVGADLFRDDRGRNFAKLAPLRVPDRGGERDGNRMPNCGGLSFLDPDELVWTRGDDFPPNVRYEVGRNPDGRRVR